MSEGSVSQLSGIWIIFIYSLISLHALYADPFPALAASPYFYFQHHRSLPNPTITLALPKTLKWKRFHSNLHG